MGTETEFGCLESNFFSAARWQGLDILLVTRKRLRMTEKIFIFLLLERPILYLNGASRNQKGSPRKWNKIIVFSFVSRLEHGMSAGISLIRNNSDEMHRGSGMARTFNEGNDGTFQNGQLSIKWTERISFLKKEENIKKDVKWSGGLLQIEISDQ